MARAKKEAALTPEERLQAALVPDWEWPYKLPENWCWVKASAVARIYTGNSISEKIKADKYAGQQEGLLFIATKDIGFDNAINYETDIRIPDYPNFKIAPANTALLCIEGGSAGRKVGFVNREVCFGNKLCVFAAEKVNSKFIYYILQSQYFIQQFNNRKHGLIGGVSVNDLAEIGFPLSPLAEQQRIVDRIESLFAKLDEAKEKAQAVVDSFETRKAAILHKAFTGELTAKWREEHGVRMESWEVRTLDSVCSSIFDGDHMPPPKAESGIPFLVISNVNTGHLTFENTRFVPQEYYDTLSDTRKPQLGDVLYTLVGSFGIPVVVNSKRPFCFQRHMALLRPIDVSPQFLWYILQTPEMYDKASSIATGTAQLTVPIKGLRAMTIPRPNIAEQVEIVRILDDFFAREQSAKEAAEAVLDQIDLMKKSILARAFRGELGTNDPSEESAVELLKQIF